MSFTPTDAELGLRNPLEASDPALQQRLNDIARKQILESQSKKRKRAPGGNKFYTDAFKAKAAAEAIRLDSVTQASKAFEWQLGHRIADSTLRGWVKAYKQQLADGEPVNVYKSGDLPMSPKTLKIRS